MDAFKPGPLVERSISLHFTNRFGDLLIFNWCYLFTRPFHWFLYGGVGLLAGLAFSPKDLGSDTYYRGVVIVCALFTLFIFVGSALITTLLLGIQWITKKHYAFLTEKRLTIDDEGIHDENMYSKSTTKWPGVFKLSRGPGRLFIYNGPNQAYIVPNSAFESKAQRAEFIHMLQQSIKQSRAKVVVE